MPQEPEPLKNNEEVAKKRKKKKDPSSPPTGRLAEHRKAFG